MEITENEVKALAKLAKLEFEGERLKSFTREFSEVVNLASKINDGAEGASDTVEVDGRAIAFEELRSDEAEFCFPCEKILSDALDEDGYFSVKRLVK